MRQIAGAVTFLAPGRKPDDPLRVTRDRGLFYEGPLAAGAAVKWRVGARGTGYRVALNDERLLDEATLAGPDAFAQLLSANTRSVRVHGAAMLTRMRDERAAPAIDKLREEARDEEAATLASLARAAAAVYTCEVVVTPSASGKGSASVCVMNTSDTAQGPLRAVLTLTRRASKATPADDDRAVSSMPLGRAVTIPAKSGVRVHGAAEVAAAALTEVVTEVVVEHER